MLRFLLLVTTGLVYCAASLDSSQLSRLLTESETAEEGKLSGTGKTANSEFEGDICNVNKYPVAGDEPHNFYMCRKPTTSEAEWPWKEIGLWTKMKCKLGKWFSPEQQMCKSISNVRRMQQNYCATNPTFCEPIMPMPQPQPACATPPCYAQPLPQPVALPAPQPIYNPCPSPPCQPVAPPPPVYDPCPQPPCQQPAPIPAPVYDPCPQPPCQQPAPVYVPPPQPVQQCAQPPCQPAPVYVPPPQPVQQCAQPPCQPSCQPQQPNCPQPVIPRPCPSAPNSNSGQRGGRCSWMLAPLVPDSGNPRGFLQCVPRQPGEYCGIWLARPCAPGTRFDGRLQVCVHDESAQAVSSCAPQSTPIGPCNVQQQCPGQATCQAPQNTCCQPTGFMG